jgi:uncharacterized protein (AIM24 family)
MSNINEEKLAPIEIDLNPQTIDEGYLRALGGQIELLLKMMFGGSLLPTAVRGTNKQVSAFARALGNEKKYLQSFEKHGLTDKRTLGNRHKLEKAIANFERETGIKWPFK